MKRSLCLLSVLFALLFTTALSANAADEAKGKHFPKAGIDLIHHELQVGIYTIGENGADGELLETMKFKGRMLLERGDPYTNGNGHRQIDFLVKEWEAFAWSNVLQTIVNYRLTEGLEQDFSSITAQQTTSDYPAKFDFSVGFTSTVFGVESPNPEGNPVQEGFFEVPPSGNRRTSPTIYGFETFRIEVDHPEHGRLRFVPLECNDSEGDTLVTFEGDSPARDRRLLKPRA